MLIILLLGLGLVGVRSEASAESASLAVEHAALEARARPSEPESTQDWLKSIDSRIRYPEGLQALSFVFQPGAKTGDKTPYRVRVRWRSGVGSRIDFVLENGTESPEIPIERGADGQPTVSPENQQELMRHFLESGRDIVARVRGKKLSEENANYVGRVVKNRVNGREEVTLHLEPASPVKVRRKTISLNSEGLPFRTHIEFLNGDEVTLYSEYESRGPEWVLVSIQHIYKPKDPKEPSWSAQDKLTYQVVKGLTLLASVEKSSRDLPPTALGKTELLDMKVNEDVPSFIPMPESLAAKPR